MEARRKGDEAADNAEKEIIKSKIADKLEKVAALQTECQGVCQADFGGVPSQGGQGCQEHFSL